MIVSHPLYLFPELKIAKDIPIWIWICAMVTNYIDKFTLTPQLRHGFRQKQFNYFCSWWIFKNFVKISNWKKSWTFYDRSRAFDSVERILLLRKLENMGVRGNPFKWIESYLLNREQVTARVPQGTILEHLLLSFIREIVRFCYTPVFMQMIPRFKCQKTIWFSSLRIKFITVEVNDYLLHK